MSRGRHGRLRGKAALRAEVERLEREVGRLRGDVTRHREEALRERAVSRVRGDQVAGLRAEADVLRARLAEQEESSSAARELESLRAEVSALRWRLPGPEAAAETARLEAHVTALSEQVADLRVRLDDATQLVAHVTRTLVDRSAPPPPPAEEPVPEAAVSGGAAEEPPRTVRFPWDPVRTPADRADDDGDLEIDVDPSADPWARLRRLPPAGSA